MVTEKQMQKYLSKKDMINKKDVCNDHKNRNNGFNSRREYLDDIAKKKGFDSYKEYADHLIREKGFSNRTDYNNHLAQKRGFANLSEEFVSKIGFKSQGEYRRHLFMKKTGRKFIEISERLNSWAKNIGYKDYMEYLDIIAIGRGFTCYEEYSKVWTYYPGMIDPMTENRSTKNFIGCMAELCTSKIFENIQRMHHSNQGYDFICDNGKKIEVKGAILNQHNQLSFHIRYNHIADYFVLIGFNDILELNPIHIWIIKSGEVIQELPINDRHILHIPNTDEYISHMRKYELLDKLEKLKISCMEFNNKKLKNVPTKAQIYDTVLEMRLAEKSKVDYSEISNTIKEKNGTKSRLIPIPANESNK